MVLEKGGSLKGFLFLMGFLGVAGQVGAQVSNLRAEGALAPMQDPGCIAIADVGNGLSPADLALGVLACTDQRDFAGAVDLFLLMQLRGVYDTRRVVDKTAHQAVLVLALDIQNSLQGPQLDELQQAFGAFGDTGSERHQKLCSTVTRSGPPEYFPAYMIQQGIEASTGVEGDGLVADFSAGAAWQELLDSYLKCPRV